MCINGRSARPKDKGPNKCTDIVLKDSQHVWGQRNSPFIRALVKSENLEWIQSKAFLFESVQGNWLPDWDSWIYYEGYSSCLYLDSTIYLLMLVALWDHDFLSTTYHLIYHIWDNSSSQCYCSICIFTPSAPEEVELHKTCQALCETC